jgi:hypothetical protein
MKRFGFVCLAAGLLLLCSSGLFAQGRFSVQFDDTPLNRVLDALKRFDPTLQFALEPDLANIRITASLVDVTVDAALGIILSQAGLMAVKDGGIYHIRAKPEAREARGDRPAPRFPPPQFTFRPTAPGEGAGAAAAPGAAPGAAGAAPGASEEEDLPLRLIYVKFADPADMAYMFGGDAIYSSAGGGGGGGYGGGSSGGSSGGYGGSSGGYGGSSGGSSRGGSSRGGSSGYGGSSGGSSRGGSSRGGSSRGGSGY